MDLYTPVDLMYLLTRWILLIRSCDIETNPGPQTHKDGLLSILHQNIRGIRNKLEYIMENFLDHGVLCFAETELDNISDDYLKIEVKKVLY